MSGQYCTPMRSKLPIPVIQGERVRECQRGISSSVPSTRPGAQLSAMHPVGVNADPKTLL